MPGDLRRFRLINPVGYYDVLIHVYKLTGDQIAVLTDRQIDEWYFRERDSKGAIRPAPPLEAQRHVETLDEIKAKFFTLGSTLGVPKELLEQRWQQKMEGM